MPLQDEDRPADGRDDAPSAGYEKPAIVWEESIDVKRLSIGCTRQEFKPECTSVGQPFS